MWLIVSLLCPDVARLRIRDVCICRRATAYRLRPRTCWHNPTQQLATRLTHWSGHRALPPVPRGWWSTSFPGLTMFFQLSIYFAFNNQYSGVCVCVCVCVCVRVCVCACVRVRACVCIPYVHSLFRDFNVVYSSLAVRDLSQFTQHDK